MREATGIRPWLTLDGSPIGQGFRDSHLRRSIAGGIALGALTTDLALVHAGMGAEFLRRLLIPALAVVAYRLACGGERRSLGLMIHPVGGWCAWVVAVLILGVILAALLLASTALLAVLGLRIPLPAIPREWLGASFVRLVVQGPVVEEATYRLAFVPGCVALIGPWPTVVLGGVVFAGLHVLYGNYAPDNMVVGFVLTWAFLRSGSIVVPWFLHALGNLAAFAAQAANAVAALGALD